MDEIEKIFGAALKGGELEKAESSPPASVFGDPAEGVKAASDMPLPEPMCRLASFVLDNFRANADARRNAGVDDRLEYALNVQKLKYSPAQVEKMRSVGISERMFSPITLTKVRAAKSMLCDLISSNSEPLFSIQPTPEADRSLDEEVLEKTGEEISQEINDLFGRLSSQGVQELPPQTMAMIQQLIAMKTTGKYDEVSHRVDALAKRTAARMQKKVWDKMHEGGFTRAFMDFCVAVCTYGTGVMIGPYERVEACNRCTRNRKTGVKKFERVFRSKLVYESVNPQDCYPAPDALRCTDGPFCIRVKFSSSELWRYTLAGRDRESRKVDGWNSQMVSRLLARHPNGGVKLNDEPYSPERRDAENRGPESYRDCTFEGIRCFASVRGSILSDMGIVKNRDGSKIRETEYYKVEAVVVDGLVLFCRIYDERMEFPISKGVFYDLPGSWWGMGVADALYMCQYVQNNCIKSLVQNMAAASGPQIWINDAQRLVNKSPDAMKLRPFKAWAFGASMMGASGAPMGVLSVPSNASELLTVFDKMGRQADLDSGIPAYMEGQTSATSGAMRTAAGLKTFTEAATRQIKLVMAGLDENGICEVARRTADWLLINDDDMDAKGDVEVRAVGLIGRVLKVQRDDTRAQVLNMVQNSQILSQIAGVKGILELFRPVLEDIDVNPDNVVPNEERMKELELLEKIKQVFQATANAQGVAENSMPPDQGQAAPQVQQPQGGVEQRRGVA